LDYHLFCIFHFSWIYNSNTPIEGMWIAVSVLQMMSYMTLMNLNFPQNLLTFLEYVETVHNFNKWFPNPFVYLFPEKFMDMTSYNEQFQSRGFTNRNLLYLCGSDLALLCLTVVCILILIPISRHISYFFISENKKIDSQIQYWIS